jgi:hypothetical protein
MAMTTVGGGQIWRVGCVGIDTSHPRAFSRVFVEAGLPFSYSAVFNDGFRTEAEVEAFMALTDSRRYTSLDAMAAEVDIAFIHDCNWDRHMDLADAFIREGIPVFIDKPIVGTMDDCNRFEELSASGARVIGGSSLRFAYEVAELRNTLAQSGETPLCVTGTCGVDEFNYGIHIVEALLGLLGPGAVSVRWLGCAAHAEAPLEHFLVEWKGGARAIYHVQTGPWQPCHLMVQTDVAVHHRAIDITKVYESLLKHIADYMRGEAWPCDGAMMTEPIRICLAGKRSRDSGGEPVLLSDMTSRDPGFNGAVFARAYAAANRV